MIALYLGLGFICGVAMTLMYLVLWALCAVSKDSERRARSFWGMRISRMRR